MRTLIQAWLDSQCAQTAGIASGLVMLLPRNGSALVSAATWPRGGRPPEELELAARSAYERSEPLAQPRANGAPRPFPVGPVISSPIQVQGRTVGAMAWQFGPDVALPSHQAIDHIQRGAQSFESFLNSGLIPARAKQPSPKGKAVPSPASTSAPSQPAASAAPLPASSSSATDKTVELPASNSARVLHLLATVESHERFRAAATAFATELASMFDCDRVSVGLSGRRHVRVEAVSHSAEFGAKQALLRDIGAAMEEAIWQGATLMFPLPEGAQPRVDRAHATLAQRHGAASLCTVPLVRSGKPIGAIVLERNRATPLPRAEVSFCENVAALLGPTLELRRAADRPWPTKLGAALAQAAAPLTGPGHRALKIGVAALVVLLLGAAFISAPYRVSAPARLEGAVQRVLVAPADGYLKIAHARPGDRVKAGQVLAELADEDFKLELRKAQSQVAQLQNAYGDAMAKYDRAEVAVLYAKLEEARAQLALAEHQLERTQLAAPFDGVLLTGDLTQSLGAPVKKGDPLMTVAPEHDFRVIVEVDERDVGDLKVGQRGSLALTALPGDTMPIQVARITPVATAAKGRNYFEVEARTEAADPELRPGLLGVAKVDAGSRTLLWIWTHRIFDWVRLTLWSWVG
jgi:RND family efflux transporter MFP subunit